MFNKKKFKKEIEAYSNAVEALLTSSRAQLAEIKAITDAGERYVALADFEKDLQDKQKQIDSNFEKRARDLGDEITVLKSLSLVFGGLGVAGAGFAMLMTAVVPPLGAAAIIVGAITMGTGATPSLFSEGMFEGAACQKIDAAKTEISQILTDVTRGKEAVLDKELKSVATSARFNELYRRPEVKLAFDAAAVRERAWDEGHANRLDGKKFNP